MGTAHAEPLRGCFNSAFSVGNLIFAVSYSFTCGTSPSSSRSNPVRVQCCGQGNLNGRHHALHAAFCEFVSHKMENSSLVALCVGSGMQNVHKYECDPKQNDLMPMTKTQALK